ncbi:hypothetical protein HMPREF9137_0728 [Prevotella denticola F0289]|nr:hypothetical protein HMPREF9137_0728 [Prevotella denticola F0289]
MCLTFQQTETTATCRFGQYRKKVSGTIRKSHFTALSLISFHENKYFSSRKEIFIFMKRNVSHHIHNSQQEFR